MLDEGDPTERIAVLRSDLDQWRAILQWSYGLASAHDLIEGYRSGRPNMKTSKLTNLAAKAHNRIEGYLESDNGSLQED